MEDRTASMRKGTKDNNQVQDMDEESSDEEPDDSQREQPPIQPPMPPIPDKVLVKKYDPKQSKISNQIKIVYLKYSESF